MTRAKEERKKKAKRIQYLIVLTFFIFLFITILSVIYLIRFAFMVSSFNDKTTWGEPYSNKLSPIEIFSQLYLLLFILIMSVGFPSVLYRTLVNNKKTFLIYNGWEKLEETQKITPFMLFFILFIPSNYYIFIIMELYLSGSNEIYNYIIFFILFFIIFLIFLLYANKKRNEGIKGSERKIFEFYDFFNPSSNKQFTIKDMTKVLEDFFIENKINYENIEKINFQSVNYDNGFKLENNLEILFKEFGLANTCINVVIRKITPSNQSLAETIKSELDKLEK